LGGPEAESQLDTLLRISYELTGDHAKAVPLLERARKKRQSNEQVSVSLARCYRETGQTELTSQTPIEGFNVVRSRWAGV
jgi:thioredoxin-like negative regulator of GroEL